jgi:hypothetical protein
MKSISHRTLLIKSRNYRNEEAILKLARTDSLKEWANNFQPSPLPSYQKPPKVKLTAGLYNFILQLKP